MVRLRFLRPGPRGLLAAPGEGVEPHQQGGPEREHERHRGERRPAELWRRCRAEIRAEPQALERHVADVKPARAADLVLAVDVMHLLAGVLVNAGPGFLDQLTTRAELQRPGRARFDTGGRETLLLPIGAEGALP